MSKSVVFCAFALVSALGCAFLLSCSTHNMVSNSPATINLTGSDQQIRIILAGGNVTLTNNPCGSMANCVTLTSDTTNTPLPLLLSSQAQTGIKIPSGQIAGGQFVVAAGETKDLNIDFNACAS